MSNENNIADIKSYSLRKIPVVNLEKFSVEDNDTDKIKILELSNFIDEWEHEVLFTENGFYSLKGKEAENKSEEFILELKKIVNSRIQKINFIDMASKEIAIKVKNIKIESIYNRMKQYENIQLNEWRTETFDNSLTSSIRRAALYKDNSEIISSSYNNAITVLELMSKNEKWDKKTFLSKKNQFESEFYSNIVTSFINEKNIKAYIFFEKYKDKIEEKKRKEFEQSTKKLKNNIIAYNYAKELFSYNLTDKEKENEIKSVKDSEIKTLIKTFISDLDRSKKQTEEEEKKEKNASNWKEIISILNSEPDKAFLYIDFSCEDSNQNAKLRYIKNIRKNGYINTDKTKFFEILKEIRDDYKSFIKKDIYDFYEYLSAEDFNIIEYILEKAEKNLELFESDYDYISNEINKNKIKSEETIYLIVKLIIESLKSFQESNKKEADIEQRNKLIKSVIERYQQKENKEGERDDSIKHSARK